MLTRDGRKIVGSMLRASVDGRGERAAHASFPALAPERRLSAAGPIALRADRLGADPIQINAPASSKLAPPQRTAATDFSSYRNLFAVNPPDRLLGNRD